MKNLQIKLKDEHYEFLEEEAERMDSFKSTLVRKYVDEKMKGRSR